MKNKCDECKRKRNCNVPDRSRGMPCKDFEKEQQEKQEENKWKIDTCRMI